MAFTLHQEGVVMSSQITHAGIQHTLLSPCTIGTCALISVLRHFCSSPQQHHVTASHPSSGDKPPERGRAVIKNIGRKAKMQKLNYLNGH